MTVAIELLNMDYLPKMLYSNVYAAAFDWHFGDSIGPRCRGDLALAAGIAGMARATRSRLLADGGVPGLFVAGLSRSAADTRLVLAGVTGVPRHAHQMAPASVAGPSRARPAGPAPPPLGEKARDIKTFGSLFRCFRRFP
jgi:hypothetical protein